MSIDPNTIKQLLQIRFLQGLNLSGSSDNDIDNGSASGDFADILQSLIQETRATAGRKIIPAAELLKMTEPYAPALFSANIAESDTKPTSFEPIIQKAAAKHGVDPALVKAVIQQESSFDPKSVSKAGAKGLMQLMDDTARGFGVTDSFDPEQNIEAGTQFLSGLLRKYGGNEAMALAAYNAGPGRVDRLGVRSDAELYGKLGQLPKETQGYVKRVLDYKRQFV